MKKEDLSVEMSSTLRNFLVKHLMGFRRGRGIISVIGEANVLFNTLFLLDDAGFLDHGETDLPEPIKDILNGAQQNFLYCVLLALEGRTHECLELLIADARHISSYIWSV